MNAIMKTHFQLLALYPRLASVYPEAAACVPIIVKLGESL